MIPDHIFNFKILILAAFAVALFLMGGVPLHAQDDKSHQTESGLVEFFTVHLNKKAAKEDSLIYPAKLIIAPIVSYSPETSLAFGIGAKYLFKIKGSGDGTRTSNMPVAAQYTLKNQFILYSGFEIFWREEKWMLTGNFGFQEFPRFYYGLGDDTPSSNEIEYNYNQVLIEPILLKRALFKYLFVGAGMRYNRISRVEFENLEGITVAEEVPGAFGSESVGAEFAVVYDSRDNLLNAVSGWYFEFTYGVYDKRIGSSHGFNLTRFDLRHYWTLSERRRDVLGFQFLGHFTDQDAPLSELAYFGGAEMMRGYYEGRYIDRTMLAVQAEYRRHLFGRFGGVLFAGVGNVQPEIGDYSFRDLDHSVGFGLRFLLESREKLNLRFDWGFGQNTNNYYLNIAEAF